MAPHVPFAWHVTLTVPMKPALHVPVHVAFGVLMLAHANVALGVAAADGETAHTTAVQPAEPWQAVP